MTLKYIFPKKFELKIEHRDTHSTILYLDMTNKNGFTYKFYDKRDTVAFLIVRIPKSSNIPSSTLHGLLYSELLRIGRCNIAASECYH